MTILVIEDEAAMAALMRTRLDGLGGTVVCAATWAEALRVLAVPPPPVLITYDIKLPDANEDTAVANILHMHAIAPDAQVLIVSGHVNPETVARIAYAASVHAIPKDSVVLGRALYAAVAALFSDPNKTYEDSVRLVQACTERLIAHPVEASH